MSPVWNFCFVHNFSQRHIFYGGGRRAVSRAKFSAFYNNASEACGSWRNVSKAVIGREANIFFLQHISAIIWLTAAVTRTHINCLFLGVCVFTIQVQMVTLGCRASVFLQPADTVRAFEEEADKWTFLYTVRHTRKRTHTQVYTLCVCMSGYCVWENCWLLLLTRDVAPGHLLTPMRLFFPI